MKTADKKIIGFAWWQELLIWIPLTIPFLAYLLWQADLPSEVASHYGLNGKPDRTMKPFEFMLIMTVIGLFTSSVLYIAPRIDPKKNNYPHFKGLYFTVRIFVNVLMAGIVVMSYLEAMGNAIPIPRIISAAVMLLFLILGNHLGKVRNNYFVGIRTPWTLQNEEVWRRTHRLAAKLLSGSAAISIILSFFVTEPFLMVLILGTVLIGLIFPTVYSYFVYRSLKSE
ncbi:MAG: DUF1648 domain-containing protein [Bacteroidetes bacterium]|nr:MAG: DUF1648 domain-containing protein [Bacteroidota bacterium]